MQSLIFLLLVFRGFCRRHLLARRQGIATHLYILGGFGGSGVLAGLAGGILVQIQRYTDINMGQGIVIHVLASLMLGEMLVGRHTLCRQLLAPACGALLYQQIQGFALSWGLAPSDLKAFTGGLVLCVLFFQRSARKEAF